MIGWGSLLYWGLLAAVPIGIILLYFLKLRRQPVEVPSTFLWQRALEDLQVNSLWQRLRKNLLLFLQLLFALLVIAALLPWNDLLDWMGWQWEQREPLPQRLVLVIDRSASMQASDVSPSRLTEAKRMAGELIERMTRQHAAMIISFADEPRVVQGFTSDRGLLQRRLDEIQPSAANSRLEDALRAAQGLATTALENAAADEPQREPLPATLYLFSDGGVERVPELNLGSLQPEYVPVGQLAGASNVAIVNLTADEQQERQGEYQAFTRLQNFSDAEVTGDLVLTVNGRERDRAEVTLPSRNGKNLQFELANLFDANTSAVTLELQWTVDDDLPLDNTASVVLAAPRPGRVLLVTPGNRPLALAMQTETLAARFNVEVEQPGFLQESSYQQRAAAGAYDLIVYDRCAPSELPIANTVFFGVAPDTGGWQLQPAHFPSIVIDVNQTHPITQLVDLRSVLIVEAQAISGPPGSVELVEANEGTIMASAPRGSFEDVVIGFPLYQRDDQGEVLPNTDWQRNLSFPIFVQNLVEHLAGRQTTVQAPSLRPGQQINLRPQLAVDRLRVTDPAGVEFNVLRDRGDSLTFYDTDRLGVYEVREGDRDEVSQRFVVNLFDARESDLQVREEMAIGYDQVRAVTRWQSATPEFWKWLLLAGCVLLVVEWYVYNRRVYL